MPHEPLLAAILEGIGSTGRGGRPRETLLDPREPARRAPQVRVDRGSRRGPEGPGGKSRGEVHAGGGRMSLGESDLRRGMAVLDQYREQIEALAQQQDIVRISLEEHMRARETLTRYQEAGKGAEVLVPVGANSFLVAESKDVDKAFVSIGSDLLVYDDIAQQIERLDARIKSITDAANAIGQRLGGLQRRAQAQGAARTALDGRA